MSERAQRNPASSCPNLVIKENLTLTLVWEIGRDVQNSDHIYTKAKWVKGTHSYTKSSKTVTLPEALLFQAIQFPTYLLTGTCSLRKIRPGHCSTWVSEIATHLTSKWKETPMLATHPRWPSRRENPPSHPRPVNFNLLASVYFVLSLTLWRLIVVVNIANSNEDEVD